ncbi:cytochrome-c peroxidase [Bradyrhizobium sp. SZCCHNRI20481]|uniref:cytochrome-c peroxidase n=1 Tax=Bradyrhizobium sp. SZCCHNRI20481 TaxID=3057286 RepID=UPI002915CFB4|nr:cytochrome-c peroxidase [Bradyrhizobium sp. SZCCHNRI20481]
MRHSHDPARAFIDGRSKSVSIYGRVGQRNAPTALNAFYYTTQLREGRVHTLEQQAALSITNPFEQGSSSVADAASRIAGDKDYQAQFMDGSGREVNEKEMLRAIASYGRALISFDSPFDNFVAGDANAISDAAERGWDLINTKARCNLCYAPTENERDVTFLSDNKFHHIGIGFSSITLALWHSRRSVNWCRASSWIST